MEVFIAEFSGFCFGVERAISLVESVAKEGSNVVTYGPIIHNPQVVEELNEKGVRVINSAENINKDMRVVIRSHGVGREKLSELNARALEVIDATCPFVKKAQNKAHELSKNCDKVVILGEAEHPEVMGIISYIDGDFIIVANEEEAAKLPFSQSYGLLAQTTQNKELFSKISDILKGKCDRLEIAKTICNATDKRQHASYELARNMDVMVVVGGKNSANTTRLCHLCKEICPRTYHIETIDELSKDMFQGVARVGITAGASTPLGLVSKVREYILRGQQMKEEKKGKEEMMEDFEALIEESLQQPQRGETVKGTVAQINADDVLIDFGYKTEGVAARSEFDSDLKVGDSVELAIVSFAGGSYVQLSRKSINEKSDWDGLKTASESDESVLVKIVSHVDKGFVGKIGEIPAFIPDNHIDLNTKNIDPKSYVGKTLPAKVLKFGGKKRSALVSPRIHLIKEAEKVKTEFFDKIKIGDKIKGIVKTIKEYGAFVNLGNIDGFLHKNEMSHGRVKNPAKLLAEGDKVEVIVLEMDNVNHKISIGMKQLMQDPWEEAEKKYPIDSEVKGSVITRKRAGYVIEIEPGIDGFIPNEELSWLKNSRTSLNNKDVVTGRVVDYDKERKRVILSVKALSGNPWADLKKNHPEGSLVNGKIKNITDFGLFVDFGGVIDGLVRKSDVSWTQEPEDLNELFKVGQTIDAKILTIDEERERVSLGIKQLEVNPWKEMAKLMPAGKVVEAKVAGVTKTGVELDLGLHIKGFIALNELDPSKPSLDQFKEGDMVTAIVLKSEPRAKQVNLSIKKYLYDSERRETREYMKKLADSDSSFSFGSILKDKFSKAKE